MPFSLVDRYHNVMVCSLVDIYQDVMGCSFIGIYWHVMLCSSVDRYLDASLWNLVDSDQEVMSCHEVGSKYNATGDLCLGSSWFESHLGHRLLWLRFLSVDSSDPLSKFQDITPNLAMNISFHILSKSTFTCHPTIWCYIILDIDSH
jgi:hypothetical protein